MTLSEGLTRVARGVARTVLPGPIRRAIQRWIDARASVSAGHQVIARGDVPPELLEGWRAAEVARRQQEAFDPILEEMRRGRPREDFVAVSTAVERTGIAAPSIIEVGCGGGWNSEVISTVARREIAYTGLDYSPAMTAVARERYPRRRFVVGDATALPFRDGASDIVLSGGVLMHVLEWEKTIRESRRVARRFCIFHTVPVVKERPMTRLRKLAYRTPVIENSFNEGDLLAKMRESGLTLRESFPCLAYDLANVLGEPSTTRTYLCEVAPT